MSLIGLSVSNMFLLLCIHSPSPPLFVPWADDLYGAHQWALLHYGWVAQEGALVGFQTEVAELRLHIVMLYATF